MEHITQPCRIRSAFTRLLAFLPIKRFRNTAPVVAVLPLIGVIAESKGGPLSSRTLSLSGLEKSIDQAFSMPKVKAVALIINSPGGSPVQSEYISKRIRALSLEKNIPVISFVEDVAASGGYWLACTSDEIFASESSIIGSIGVVSSGFGFVDSLKKLGVERRVYTQGANKNILDPYLPEKEKDIAIIQGLMKDAYETFTDFVQERRGDKLKNEDGRLFSGEFWAGRTALKLGLIDAIGDVHSVMRERYGNKVKLVKVEKEKGFLKRTLGASGMFAAVLVDAVAVKLEERALWSRFGL